MQYLEGHFSPKEHKRIFKKIRKRECWIWTGAVDYQGYGLVWYRGRTERIHRLMFAHFVLPIPKGISNRSHAQIDHLCRRPNCCRPEHLEMVTQQTNILRGENPTATNAKKTHCKHGHQLSEGNNRRYCKTCDSLRHKQRMVGPKREYWLAKAREATKKNYSKNHS